MFICIPRNIFKTSNRSVTLIESLKTIEMYDDLKVHSIVITSMAVKVQNVEILSLKYQFYLLTKTGMVDEKREKITNKINVCD